MLYSQTELVSQYDTEHASFTRLRYLGDKRSYRLDYAYQLYPRDMQAWRVAMAFQERGMNS